MKRKEFLSKLTALLSLLGIPKIAAAQATQKTNLLTCSVAGLPYYQWPRVSNHIRVQDILHLQREPANPHDHHAIAVYWNKHKLGYIPRKDNKVIKNLMDQGKTIKAG